MAWHIRTSRDPRVVQPHIHASKHAGMAHMGEARVDTVPTLSTQSRFETEMMTQ